MAPRTEPGRELSPAFRALAAASATIMVGLVIVGGVWFIFLRSTPAGPEESGPHGPEFIGTLQHQSQAAALEPLRSTMTDEEFEKTFGPALREERENPEIVIGSSADIDRLPLRVNKLSAPTITDAGLARLAKKAGIRQLDLSENKNITDAGMKHVAAIRGLERLKVSGSGITDAGVEHLEGCSLTYFAAWHCKIGNRGLRVLATMTGMQQLQLKGCAQITDAGVSHLSVLQNLHTLQISECPRVTDASIPALAGVQSLTFIMALDSGITEAGSDDYQTRRPDGTLYR